MANITRRQPQQQALRRFDPFRMDPFRLDPFQMMREMMQLTPFTGEEGGMLEFRPRFEVAETKDGYRVRGDLPGVREEDLDISVEGNMLTVRGKREEEKREEGDEYHLYERSFGSFTRTFSLPESADIENIRAELTEGVLTIAMPRREGVGPRKVQIGNGGARKQQQQKKS
jgi:HSP20 family protein